MKKFAFILMGPDYNPHKDRAVFEKSGCSTYIFTVRNFAECRKLVFELQEDGFGAVELCGAFGKEKAAELADVTGGRMAIGYVVHDPEMDSLFESFFGK